MTDYRLPETAEASIVGCVLLYPETKRVAEKIISESDFKSPLYGAMFSAALELEEPDSMAFRKLVKDRGITLPDGFFKALGDSAILPHNLELYATILRENSRIRKLEELSKEILEAVNDEKESAEIISHAMSRLEEMEHGVISDIATPAMASNAFFDHRERVENGKGAIPTGFGPLDGILGGGMLRSGMYVLAARPGMGKTTAALQFADSVAKNVGPVLFVSLEMAVEQIQGKRLARMTGIDSNTILLGKEEDLDYGKIVSSNQELMKLPLYISLKPSATVEQIRRMAKDITGLQLIVVDYIGKIEPADKKASRYESITNISAGLKTLAVEMEIPVLALCQLNRENTGRNDKRPQLSDLRDSGAIEQDADGVIMLHRSDYYEMSEERLKPWESVDLEIIVRKNRHGGIGQCKAGFFPATGKIIKKM